MGTAALISLQLRMFLLMLLGLFLRKKNIITEDGRKCLTDLVIYVVLPCNIVQSFCITFDTALLQSFLAILSISVGIQIFCFVLAKVLYRNVAAPQQKVLQYGTMVSNAGFLGNPVAEGVFGSVGLAYASVYLVPMRVVMWSAGVACFTEAPNKKAVAKQVATHPCILAVGVGLVLMFTQAPLPDFLSAALSDVSGCNTGLSMIVIGTILAQLDFKTLFQPSVLWYSALRLVGIPLVVYLACTALGAQGLVTGVAVLLAAMPAASTTAILAAKYNGDAVYASRCVILSTLLSLITTPLWSMLLLQGIA